MKSSRDGVFLGIDIGTTVLKVGVFDRATGALITGASRNLKTKTTQDGGREQSPEAVLRLLFSALRESRENAGRHWTRIAGIGVAAQGGSSIIADRVSGRAHTPMILWNDGRTREHNARIAEETSSAYWRKIALRDVPPAGLGRLLWLRETRGELYHGGNIHCGIGEYVLHQLTGVWRQDAGHAIQIGGYDAAKGTVAQGPLDLVELPLSFFAPLRNGHETSPLSSSVAKRLGLGAGIPVAGPYIDQEAGFLASLGKLKRPLQCSLGTAWVGNFVLPPRLRGGSPYQLVLPNPAGDGRLVVQPLLSGNAAWDWALASLIGGTPTRALDRAEKTLSEQPLPPRGLTAIPWHGQPNPMCLDANGAGAVFGMSATTSREALVRAVAAGMVCELRRVFDAVVRHKFCDGVVLCGGASKGSYFQRLIATAFAPLPVFRLADEDYAAARGTLYGLRKDAARGKVVACKPLAKRWASPFDSCYDDYIRAFDRVYGNIPAGNAFSIGKESK
ncbi:MAG: gluconate kinase [Candidatus Hydrogenedentota bacterium]